jgi:hypothetical protein
MAARKSRVKRIPRPPREWARHVIEGVKMSGSASDPNAVMGDLWYHKLSARQRAAVKRRYGR